QGPFRTNDKPGLSGGSSQLAFACAGGSRCGVKLTADGAKVRLELHGDGGRRDAVRLPGAVRLAYVDAEGVAASWPPTTEIVRRLGSVALVVGPDASPSPLAMVRLWRDEPLDCEFDPILEDCRGSSS